MPSAEELMVADIDMLTIGQLVFVERTITPLPPEHPLAPQNPYGREAYEDIARRQRLAPWIGRITYLPEPTADPPTHTIIIDHAKVLQTKPMYAHYGAPDRLTFALNQIIYILRTAEENW